MKLKQSSKKSKRFLCSKIVEVRAKLIDLTGIVGSEVTCKIKSTPPYFVLSLNLFFFILQNIIRITHFLTPTQYFILKMAKFSLSYKIDLILFQLGTTCFHRGKKKPKPKNQLIKKKC